MKDHRGLEAIDIRLAYGRRVVVQDLSFDVERGRSLAVVGPSGVGKTTLLWCLAGLRPPDAGEVVFAGERVHPASGRARRAFRRRHVGMVLQGGELVPELTALENVVLGGLLAGLSAGEADRRGREIMAALSLPEALMGQAAATLSGGERQRVAISRALVHRPGLLLADEPTAALDADNAVATADLLAGVPGLTGCALVVVTHDERVADRLDDRLTLRAAQVPT